MWGEVPKHFWLGKGYAVSPSDQYLAEEGVRRGLRENIEPAMISGNYHNGPLTLLIPFGLWGALGFLWLSLAGIWVMYRNYRYGDPDLKTINTFFLALLLTRLATFYTFYGDFSTDLMSISSCLGFSVALNGGVSGPASASEEASDTVESGSPETG